MSVKYVIDIIRLTNLTFSRILGQFLDALSDLGVVTSLIYGAQEGIFIWVTLKGHKLPARNHKAVNIVCEQGNGVAYAKDLEKNVAKKPQIATRYRQIGFDSGADFKGLSTKIGIKGT
jgi:hypothetical protein